MDPTIVLVGVAIIYTVIEEPATTSTNVQAIMVVASMQIVSTLTDHTDAVVIPAIPIGQVAEPTVPM